MPTWTALDVAVVLAQQAGGTDLGSLLLTGSPYALIVGGLLAVVTGKVRLEREVKERDARIAELVAAYELRLIAANADATEWKRAAFKAMGIGEQFAKVVESREP
jgi:hypothetical protein